MKTFTRFFSLAVTALALSACGQNAQPLSYNQFGLNNNGFGTGQIPTQGGCVPLQTGSFGFSATNASMNTGALYAGNIPGAGQFGQVAMGGTSLGGMGAGMIQYQPKQSGNGTLQLGATLNQSGQANLTGMIQLAPSVIQTVMYASGGMWGGGFGGMNGMPTNGVPTNTAGPCVSSIAIRAYQNLILNQTNPYGGYNPYGGMTNQVGMGGGTGQILNALVYLYLNSGTPVGPFVF
jgi:hypothetical protein